MGKIVVTNLAEFQTHLQELTDRGEDFLYRGQRDSDWPVSCAAARRLVANSTDLLELQSLSDKTLVGYLEFLIAKARMRGFMPSGFREDASSLELLAQLQHQGAATGLINCTRQPLVALWFASGQPNSRDGAVYVLPRSATKGLTSRRDIEKELQTHYLEDAISSWEPSVIGNRIVAQSSVFVLGVSAILPHQMEQIIVEKGCKTEIRSQLANVYGITEEMLFSDFPGYAVANGCDKSFDRSNTISYWIERLEMAEEDSAKATAHFDCGLAFEAVEEHASALAHYEAASLIRESMSEQGEDAGEGK